MSNFFWYDVMTTDTDAAAKFYSQVIRWSAAPAGIGEGPYTVFSANGAGVAGLVPLHDDIPKTYGAIWTGYIHVVDIDEYAKRITAAGGSLRRGPWNVSGVGRFVVAEDPYGAKFVLMHPTSREERPPAVSDSPMHVGWHELHSENSEDAFAFYSSLFGWSKGEAWDMGPMGIYQLFETDSLPVGGMMNLHGTKSKKQARIGCTISPSILSMMRLLVWCSTAARLHENRNRCRAEGGSLKCKMHRADTSV